MDDDFVNSKSMITPGVAGSATTVITGTLVSTFGFPGAITALAVSFFFGLMVLADKTVTIFSKLILYLINSITIFAVSVGLNQSGMAIIERDQPKSSMERTVAPEDEMKPFFQDWF